MGFFEEHMVNEGMHIEGNGISIDIIVVAIGKGISGFRCKEACLEILGINGLDKICLFTSEKLLSLGYDIYIGIIRERITDFQIERGLRRISYKKDGLKVNIFYDIPRDYKWEVRKYD